MPTIREALTAFFSEVSRRILEEQGANDVALRILPAAVPLSVEELRFEHDRLEAEEDITSGDAFREAANNHFGFSDRLNRIPSATGVLFNVAFSDDTISGVLEEVFERGDLLVPEPVPGGDLSNAGEAARRLRDMKRAFMGRPPPLTSNLGEYWPVFHTPGIDDLVRDEAWRHFQMTGPEILDGAARADDGLRRLLSESTSLVDPKLDVVEITEFSAEFVVLSLRRPWLDRDLFLNRSWDFEAPLSTGDGDAEQRLPCYVVATLVTRNITVSGRVRGEVPGGSRPLELTPMLNAVPFNARIVAADAPFPENLAGVEAVPVVSNVSELINENRESTEFAEKALKRNLDEQQDLEDIGRRRSDLAEKASATAIEVENLRAAGIGIQLELNTAGIVLPFLNIESSTSFKKKTKLKAKRAENRRRMTGANDKLETIRARIATLPPKADLDGNLRALQERIPQLNQRLDQLRRLLRGLNELASLHVAKGMNEVAYFCRDVPKAPDPDPDLIRFGGLRGL